MNLDYAVDRLYQVGWNPADASGVQLEHLPDGRSFPTVSAVQRQFADAGLELSLKANDAFRCVRATWAPVARNRRDAQQLPEHARTGTVVASCEREAAVYALATLTAAQAQAPILNA